MAKPWITVECLMKTAEERQAVKRAAKRAGQSMRVWGGRALVDAVRAALELEQIDLAAPYVHKETE